MEEMDFNIAMGDVEIDYVLEEDAKHLVQAEEDRKPFLDISRENSDLPNSRYFVRFYKKLIHVYVTRYSHGVSIWLHVVERFHDTEPLIVSIDVKFIPEDINDPDSLVPAVVVVCVKYRCLIFQLFHSYDSEFMDRFYEFLSNPRYTFVGVNVNTLREWMRFHHWSQRIVDLNTLAVENRGHDEAYRDMNLNLLCINIIGKDMNANLFDRVNINDRWDSLELSRDQICSAALDSFICFEIGKRLDAHNVVFEI